VPWLVCDVGAAAEKVPVVRAVGLDLGLSSLATLSDGATIENPRWTDQQQRQLAAANRALARKQRDSRNRAKARERLRRVHQRIQGRRRSYLHQISAFLVSRYDLIAFEKLNIRGLARTRLAKSILDAAWRELTWQIAYKAEEAGKWSVGVNPRGTTQMCSACGQKVAKQLQERTHQCPHCGFTLGRDHNAALNILRLGESLVGLSAKCVSST
jgi:putative transposase